MDLRERLRTDWRVFAICIAIVLTVSAPPTSLVVGGILGVVIIGFSRPFTVRMDLANWAALFLPAFATLSILWSVNQGISVRAAVTYASLAALFIATRHVVTSRMHLSMIASAYLVGCIVLVVRLIVAWALLDRSGPALRANLPDVNANYAGYALAAGLAVLLLVAGTIERRKNRLVVIGAGVALLTLGIFISESRAALLSALLLAGWYGTSRLFRSPPIRYLAIVIALAALAIATGALDGIARLTEDIIGSEGRGTSGRLELWPLAREWWLQHFFIGSGASTFRDSNEFFIGAHNIILEVGTGIGVIGVGVWALLLWGVYAHRDPFWSGAFLVVAAAPLLTGHWETAPAAWAAFAIVTKLDVATDATVTGGRATSSASQRGAKDVTT